MDFLSIAVLGPLQVTLNGALVTGFEYNKVRALLAYLAMESGQPQSRAHLCDLLWTDLAEKTARRNLTQALTVLRRALSDSGDAPRWLLADSEGVQLNPNAPVEVDARRFMSQLAAAERHAHRGWHTCRPCASRLDGALSLYRGDFLSQLIVPDSALFEEWALLWRERLRQRVFSVLERLSQYAEWRGEYGAAAAFAWQQVKLDGLRESGHRELMRLLALDGQRAAAEAQYELMQRLLQTELGVAPEEDSASLRAQVRAGALDSLRRFAPPPFNGPAAPNPLVGREAEREAVCGLVRDDDVRAVTLTGTAGIGKTRLALAAADALRFDFENGVYFVELAPVADASLVAPALAQALGVKERPGQPLAETLARWLRGQHALLVLDSYDHLLEAAALAADLLAAAPAVKVLITSRAPLRIRAEQQYPLQPLAQGAAVELFGERARAVRPEFALTSENAGDVAALCAQVDHLPLAIELIAARARAFSLDELRQQLEAPLEALAHGARDLPDRHRSLRNAIRWSFERLGAEEQRVFAHLGVFAGGATAEAAQAVVGAAPGVRSALEALVEASLAQTQTAAGETRFTLLEVMREFALEELTRSGEAAAARERHATFMAGLAAAAYDQLLGPQQAAWSARIAAEIDNVRAAIRRSLQTRDFARALAIATGVWRFCWQRGLLREGLGWFEAALAERQSVPLLAQSNALRAAGVLAWGLSDHDRARPWLEEAIVTGQASGDEYATAAAVTNLGLVLRNQGEWELASERLEEAIARNRALAGRPHAVKFPLGILAGLCVRLGRWDEASALYEESLQHNRELGDVEGTADTLAGLALAAGGRRQYAAGRQLAEEAIKLYSSLNHQYGLGLSLGALANIMRDTGAWQAAHEHYRHSLRIWLEREDAVNGGAVLEEAARLLVAQGQPDLAARLAGAAAAIRAEAKARPTPYEEERQNALLEACREQLGEEAVAAAREAGGRLTLAQAGTLALEALDAAPEG
jgi:predicted ATPase/DNA-binding SARP family transcriptional activator